MLKVSQTIKDAIEQLDKADLEDARPIIKAWLASIMLYAQDYEDNNEVSNSPFSQYRNDFRWPLAFAYAIMGAKRVENVSKTDSVR